MIKLLEDNFLPFFDKVSFMQTASAYKAFSGSALCGDIWLQTNGDKTTAIISRFGGRVYLSCRDADFAEIKDFLNIIGFSELFTEESAAKELGFSSPFTFSVLKKSVKKQKELPEIPSLKELYLGLSFGNDQDISLPRFEDFAADVSHRLRHGGATAILKEYGAALAFTSDFGAVVNGISIKKDCRSQGLGTKLLGELLCYLDGDVFAVTSTKNEKFYIKNGFALVDTAVLIRG